MKKKGLIVATIVMVLVLAVSLTTATYAWFSSQASATVDDLAITTKAADGLQIAMRNKGAAAAQEFQSGNLTYDPNGANSVLWTGDVAGWGSELGFDGIAIGEMTDAVTYWNTSKGNYPVFSGYSVAATLVNGTTYYANKEHTGVDGQVAFDAISGTKYVVNEGVYTAVGKWISGTTTYYTITGSQKATESGPNDSGLWERNTTSQAPSADNTTILANGQFLVPTGYDEAIQPIGYTDAVRNGNYYYLTMAVKPVTDIAQLGFTMQFTPTQNGVEVTSGNSLTTGSGLDGAMAAATRVNVKLETEGKVAHTYSFAPYSAFYVNSSGNALNKYSASGADGHSEAVDGAWDENGLYQILLSTNPVDAGTIYYITIEIWIEGTDTECRQETAGGGVNLAMEFLYQKVDDAANNPFKDWAANTNDTTTITWVNAA